MTEAEWLASTDPAAMLQWVTGSAHGGNAPSSRALDRHLRLFAVACCGLFDLDEPRCRRAVEVAEWFADGGSGNTRRCPWFPDAVMTDLGYLQIAHREAWEASEACYAFGMAWGATDESAKSAARQCGAQHMEPVNRAACANFLRDIVGVKPFEQVRLPPSKVPCPECSGRVARIAVDGAGTFLSFDHATWPCLACKDGKVDGHCPWLTREVLAIAGGIYAERAFAECPVLADALEDASCDSEPLLRHLRGQPEPWVRLKHCGVPEMDLECVECGVRLYGQEVEKVCRYKPTPPGVHVRGCWALDLLLGKA